MLLLACDRAAVLLGTGDAAETRGMPGRIADIIGEYRRLWVARNRIGGMVESVKKLEALLPGARAR
jgi:hypothetical protein